MALSLTRVAPDHRSPQASFSADPPPPAAPDGDVVRTIEVNGTTFVVHRGSPVLSPKVRPASPRVVTLADAQGELSITVSQKNGLRACSDEVYVRGHRPGRVDQKDPYDRVLGQGAHRHSKGRPDEADSRDCHHYA